MNKEYFETNEKIIYVSNENGKHFKKYNTDNIDEILQTENDIESINNKINEIRLEINEDKKELINCRLISILGVILGSLVVWNLLHPTPLLIYLIIILGIPSVTIIISETINELQTKKKHNAYQNTINYLLSKRKDLEKILFRLYEDAKIKKFEEDKKGRLKIFQDINPELLVELEEGMNNSYNNGFNFKKEAKPKVLSLKK